MENYEKKYKNALEWARQIMNGKTGFIRKEVEEVFPELRESEDDRIRKEIRDFICWTTDNGFITKEQMNKSNSWLAWLEKQGERKPADKVEPKFSGGDWVVNNTTLNLCHIVKVEHGQYICDDCSFPITKENEYHLWTIQDAKSGDILAFDNTIVMFKDLYNESAFHSYCYIGHGVFYITKNTMPDWWIGKGFYPATKEQCDFLFQKMRENGYEWNAEEKVLKKIEQKIAWSEEDERNLKGIIDEIEVNKNNAPDYDLATYDRFLSWLKSIKDRVHPQPKQEWSEEAAETAAKKYRDYRETCGIKDPVLLQEIEDAYYEGYIERP